MLPVCKRPAMFRRPAAAGCSVGAVAFDVAACAQSLDIGPETTSQDRVGRVYLGTISRVLSSTLAASPHLRDPGTLRRDAVRDAVLDAWENPLDSVRGGRPRFDNGGGVASKMLVAMERHADGSFHFHVAVKLHPCRHADGCLSLAPAAHRSWRDAVPQLGLPKGA